MPRTDLGYFHVSNLLVCDINSDRHLESFRERQEVRMLPARPPWIRERARKHAKLHMRREGGGILDTDQHDWSERQKHIRRCALSWWSGKTNTEFTPLFSVCMARRLFHAKLSFMGSSLVVATSLSSSSLSHASQGCKRSQDKMMMAEGIAWGFSSI